MGDTAQQLYAPSGLPLRDALANVGGDAELLRTLIADFGEELPDLRRSIRAAVNARDDELLASAAHKLRGNLSLFGAKDLAFQAELLEQAARAEDWDSAPDRAERMDAALVGFDEELASFCEETSRPAEAFVPLADYKRLEERLEQAVLRAEVSSQAKDRFLATINHELRTPMTGIMGLTDLLLATPLTSEQREYLEMARTSSAALMRVIDQMLDFSRLDAGEVTIRETALDLRSTVRAVVEIFRPEADTKGVELSVSVSDSVPLRVAADPIHLRQILVSLIGNATKFTARGSVRVTAAMEDAYGENANLVFRISDTGPGIPAGKRDAIFEPFVQIDQTATRRHGGVGLGLAVARRLASHLGGCLWLSDSTLNGSTFCLQLPCKRSTP